MTSYGAGLRLPRLRQRNRRVKSTVGAESTKAAGAVARIAALGVLALCAVGAAAFGLVRGIQAAGESERLRVRANELTGNARVSAKELAAYTGVEIGARMLDLDLDAIALQLRRHPWIESARVRRQLPDALVIDVTEHTPAILASLGDVYLADGEGRLFKRLSAADGIELPVVTGLTREDAARKPDEVQARMREAIALARAVEHEGNGLGRPDELHWDPALGWSVLVAPRADAALAYRVHLGLEPLAQLPVAVAAVAKVAAAGQDPAVVFADGKKSPGRVQVRLRGAHDETHRTLIATAR